MPMTSKVETEPNGRRNKTILVVCFAVIALGFSFLAFIEKVNLNDYKNSKYLNQSVELTCEEVVDQYETNPMSFFNSKEKFEYWEFCISKENHNSMEVLLYVFSLLAIVFFSGTFYVAKSNLVISNRALFLVLLSPLLILILVGFTNTLYQTILSVKDPNSLKNTEALSNYLILFPVFIFVWLVRKIIQFKRNKSRKT